MEGAGKADVTLKPVATIALCEPWPTSLRHDTRTRRLIRPSSSEAQLTLKREAFEVLGF